MHFPQAFPGFTNTRYTPQDKPTGLAHNVSNHTGLRKSPAILNHHREKELQQLDTTVDNQQ